MAKPRALILTGYGINCDKETRYAFEVVGAQPKIVHINDLIASKGVLPDYQILVFPGGFSYGDDTGSGKALANKIRNNLPDELMKFAESDKLVLGICNGFQVMTNLGLVPGIGQYDLAQVGLTHNTSATYECRWVVLKSGTNKCVFTQGIDEIAMPVAHGEGRFYAPENIMRKLQENGQIVLRYSQDGTPAKGEFPANPNGSLDDIAGICDPTGRLFGLMPHPERHIAFKQYPHWTAIKEQCKRKGQPLPEEGPGLRIFRNGTKYFK